MLNFLLVQKEAVMLPKRKSFMAYFQPSAVQQAQELKNLKTKMVNSYSSSLTSFVLAALRKLSRF